MPYPNGHLYLTAHWYPSGVPAEEGQFGLRFDNPGPASSALVLAAAGPLSAFWSSATGGIEPDFKLSYLRLAAVGTDGKYVPGTIAYDYTYASAFPGGAPATTARFPLQTALAASLLTAMPRGRAHRGRIYLPPINNALNSTYTYQSADTSSRANTLAARLSDLNDVMGGPLTVFSKVGTGAKNAVTGVVVGNRPDVQRRRAASQPETYSILANVVA